MPDNSDTTDGADAIRRIEETNVANILAKLKAGKVISRDEQKRLTEYQERENAAAGRPSAAAVAGKVADSMEQAAALSGYSKDDLQRAKQAGCPAFRGSRVYVEELAEWMQDNGDTLPTGNSALDAINIELAKEKLRKVRFANDVEEGRTVSRADIAPKVIALGFELKATLRKKLEEDAPDRLAGRTRAEIAEWARVTVVEICRAMQEGVEKCTR